MTMLNEQQAKALLVEKGQAHLMRFWDELNTDERQHMLEQITSVDFRLMDRLTQQWVLNEPPAESFQRIEPVETIPPIPLEPADETEQSRKALAAGEDAMRNGRAGILLVAGGQGTRLGFDGPKGAYPIGPITGKSLFAYHAEKIQNLQRRYDCVLPWYIMVSAANAEATRLFFEKHGYFGLHASDVMFFQQRMIPCVDESGKFMLESKSSLAMNPNGHGGVIPALVESGVIADCKRRGVDTLGYFQVDNWAVKVADPYFIGCHLLHGGDMSSKNHRKTEVREAVGVHCLCDGEYRVVEYSALDIYPQLLETLPDGAPRYYAGNPAIHVIGVDFVERVYAAYDDFPWWRAHKKIPYVNDDGALVKPEKPNGYKFETFVFDALRFIQHKPVALLMRREGEYTPIKQFEGDNSVRAAWRDMREHWARWFETAGYAIPRGADGMVSIPLEVSPLFALDKAEFIAKSVGRDWDTARGIAIGPDGVAQYLEA